MANPWFRMYSEFSHDPEVQMMPEAMQRRLVMLFCLRCSETTMDDASLAFTLRVSEDELRATKVIFLRNGFIDETWNLVNWQKRQFTSDSSAERVKRYRDKREAAGLKRGSSHIDSQSIFDRDSNCCVYCMSPLHLCVDHAYPVVRGGTDDERNLVTACKRCNSGKAGKTPEQAKLSFANRDAELRYKEYCTCNGYSNGLEQNRTDKKRREKKKDNAAVAVAPTFVLPDWISDEAWQGFEENRKRLRCSMTDRTRELTVRELEALRRIGHPPDAVLDQSTQRGWRGVFPLKEGRNGSTQQDRHNGHRESPAVQRQNQSFDAIDAAVARATGARPGGADEAGESSLPESGAAEWDDRHVPDGVDRPRRPLRPADVSGRVIEGYRGERVLP